VDLKTRFPGLKSGASTDRADKRWASGLDVDELGGRCLAGLRRAPVIDVGDLVHAGDSAVRGAGFLG
jgi:hypothetical protein